MYSRGQEFVAITGMELQIKKCPSQFEMLRMIPLVDLVSMLWRWRTGVHNCIKNFTTYCNIQHTIYLLLKKNIYIWINKNPGVYITVLSSVTKKW